jgi:hypothetical protein
MQTSPHALDPFLLFCNIVKSNEQCTFRSYNLLPLATDINKMPEKYRAVARNCTNSSILHRVHVHDTMIVSRVDPAWSKKQNMSKLVSAFLWFGLNKISFGKFGQPFRKSFRRPTPKQNLPGLRRANEMAPDANISIVK